MKSFLLRAGAITSCVTLALLILSTHTALAAGKQTAKAKAAPSHFDEWFAAGSGCRATHERKGDVTFEPLGLVVGAPGGPSSLRGRFVMKEYTLVSPPKNPATSIAFARECNLRVKVTPPAGKRARGVSAKATWVYGKDAAVKLQLQNTLYMDTTLVGAVFDEIPTGESFSGREKEVVIANGRWVNIPEQPPATKAYDCGASVVFGSDFTIIAHRKEKSDAANVRLGGDPKGIEFAVELEDCDGK